MTKSLTTACLALLSLLASSGCGLENGSGPTLDASATWVAEFDLGADDEVVINADDPQTSEQTLGGTPDSVTIESGTLVIRSLRFESGSAVVDTSITADDKSRDQNDDLIRFRGPYVCAAIAPVSLGSQSVAAGRFDRVVFVIEPATNANQVGGREDLVGKSVLISGHVWRNGRSGRFEFASDYATECAVNRSGHLGAGQSCAGTLTFRTSRWFRSGSSWIDPNEATNRGTILRNIRQNVMVITVVE